MSTEDLRVGGRVYWLEEQPNMAQVTMLMLPNRKLDKT